MVNGHGDLLSFIERHQILDLRIRAGSRTTTRWGDKILCQASAPPEESGEDDDEKAKCGSMCNKTVLNEFFTISGSERAYMA